MKVTAPPAGQIPNHRILQVSCILSDVWRQIVSGLADSFGCC